MTTCRIIGMVLALVFSAVPIAHARVPSADSRCSWIPPVTSRTPDARLEWFVNPSICDLHVTPTATAVVDAGAEALEP